MSLRLAEPCLATVVLAAVATGSAVAGPALDDDPSAAPASDPAAEPSGDVEPDGHPVEYGVGIRLRNVRIPQAELELFVDRAAGGASNVGFGVDLIRRRGNIELQLGFEYERVTVGEGVWIKSGDNVAAGDQADFILEPDHAPDNEKLGWFTVEFTFLNHAPITKNISIRYGGGAGLGIVMGKLYRYDVTCNGATNASPEPGCVPSQSPFNGSGTATGPLKYDLPPVFPVVNAIVGVQFKPMEKLTVNVEGGIRTLVFFGASAAYFF